MPDSVPAAAAAQLDDPFAELRGPLAGTVRMRLEVVDNTQLTPHMQRLVLGAPELAVLAYQPGQDVMLLVAVDGNRPVRRRYTIRDLDTTRNCSPWISSGTETAPASSGSGRPGPATRSRASPPAARSS